MSDLPRVSNPLFYASGYTVDLYCDRKRDPWAHRHCESFFGETRKECLRAARKAGWLVRKDRTATCPVCQKRQSKEKAK